MASECVVCSKALDLDNRIDIVSRKSDLAKGWFTVLKNNSVCDNDCANKLARRERVPGYVTGFRNTGTTERIIESWI